MSYRVSISRIVWNMMNNNVQERLFLIEMLFLKMRIERE